MAELKAPARRSRRRKTGQGDAATGARAERPADDSDTPLIACHECGQLYHVRPLAPGTNAKCVSCGATLYKAKENAIERCLVLNLTSLVLFVVANVFPFMTLTIEGRETVNTLFSGVAALLENGLWELAAVVFLTSILVPLLQIMSMLYVLVPMYMGFRLPAMTTVFRYVEVLRPWSMMEIFLHGVFVAYVNLADLGRLELGVAVYAFVALIVIMVASQWALDPIEVWERLAPSAKAESLLGGGWGDLMSCHACQRVSRVEGAAHGGHAHCPRCGSALHRRKPNSLARTWALLITAGILYIPANVYPVMTVISFGKGAPDTILSGVKHLIEGGLWPVAILVFFASITVPVLKLLGLGYLAYSVQRRSQWRPRDRTLMYRIIEGVGRWSMIDIFMVSILVGLVKLGSVATIEPGVGAISFAAVVIITMIASAGFDPKEMWDAIEPDGGAYEPARI